jgi:hypothetical protein
MARHHFLAGAGLTENQHVGIERRDLLDEPCTARMAREAPLGRKRCVPGCVGWPLRTLCA